MCYTGGGEKISLNLFTWQTKNGLLVFETIGNEKKTPDTRVKRKLNFPFDLVQCALSNLPFCWFFFWIFLLRIVFCPFFLFFAVFMFYAKFICERLKMCSFWIYHEWINEWIKNSSPKKTKVNTISLWEDSILFPPHWCKCEPVILAFMVRTTTKIIHHLLQHISVRLFLYFILSLKTGVFFK